MLEIERLELRRLLTSLLPDVTWGNEGTLDVDGSPELVDDVTGGFLISDTEGLDWRTATFSKFSDNGTRDSSYDVTVESINEPTVCVSNDRLVVVSQEPESGHWLVRRFTAMGAVDTSFGTGGVATLTFPGAANALNVITSVTSAASDASGSVYIAAQVTSELPSDELTNPYYYDFNIIRLTSAGELDATFGDAGQLSATVVNHTTYSSPWMAVTPQGAVFAGVSSQTHDANRIERYTAAGVLDTGFGNAGRVEVSAIDYSAAVGKVDIMGRLIVHARASDKLHDQPDAIFCYTAHGLDTSFGDGGKAILPVGVVMDYDIQPDGKMIIANDGAASNAAMAFWRLTAAGQMDSTFDGDGVTDASDHYLVSQIIATADGGYLIQSYSAIERLVIPSAVELGNAGTLFVHGTNDADTVTVTQSGLRATVVFNGDSQSFSLGDIVRINADLRGGDNTFFASSPAIPMTIQSGNGRDTITSGSGDDSINSGAGDDRISAGDGADSLVGGAGSNQLFAGAGGGTISAYEIDAGDNVVTGTGDYSVYIGATGRQTITLTGAHATVECPYASASRIEVNMETYAQVYTGDGDDTIITGAGNDTIRPGYANDSVISGAGDDFVDAFEYLTEGATVCNDFYDLGDGQDRLGDNIGDNTVLGGNGNDAIGTGYGNDSIDGGQGKDIIRSGDGNDFLYGSGGRDKLFAGNGNDTVWGGGNNDTLVGGDGADILQGNRGNDLIVAIDSATTDHDTIDGGVGIDSLFGDADEDAFSIESILQSL